MTWRCHGGSQHGQEGSAGSEVETHAGTMEQRRAKEVAWGYDRLGHRGGRSWPSRALGAHT